MRSAGRGLGPTLQFESDATTIAAGRTEAQPPLHRPTRYRVAKLRPPGRPAGDFFPSGAVNVLEVFYVGPAYDGDACRSLKRWEVKDAAERERVDRRALCVEVAVVWRDRRKDDDVRQRVWLLLKDEGEVQEVHSADDLQRRR